MSKTESVGSQPAAAAPEEKAAGEKAALQAPLLSIVGIPNLCVDWVDVTFDMEVKSSQASQCSGDKIDDPIGGAEPDWGRFTREVNITGAVSCREANIRSSDRSAERPEEADAKESDGPDALLRDADR